jgi:hypothetical protein
MTLGLVALIGSVLLSGCGEPTQQAAQDSQAEIEKERKATGDDKNAY